MAYVALDAAGNIIGAFARPQPDLPGAQTIADDDPRLLKFQAQVPRLLIAKSVIIDRLQAAGKLNAARKALDAADLYTRERWNSRSMIYADDPTAVALIKAIGADPAVILLAS